MFLQDEPIRRNVQPLCSPRTAADPCPGSRRPNVRNRLETAWDADETGNVVNVIVLIAAMLFPTLLGWAVVGTAKLWRWIEGRRSQPVPVGQPIERIATDLRRLNG